jgi:hypothetical protein
MQNMTLEKSEYLLNQKAVFPIGVYTTDSLTLVVDGMKEKEIISIYNSKTLELLSSLGQKGQGPNEFGEAPSVSFSENEVIQLFDWERKRLIGASLSNILSKDSLILEYEYHLPPEVIQAQKVQKIDNTIYAGGFLDEGFLAFVNDSTLDIEYISYDAVQTENTLNFTDRKWIYNSWYAVNKRKERIVFVMERMNQILIYDFNGNLEKIVRNESFSNDYKADRAKIPYYYNTVAVTDSLIYASWIGMSASEIENTLEEGIKPSSELHVFDWSGNPKYKFELENDFISFIEVDEANHQVIIINEFSDENSVKLYQSSLIN